jgi:hypothetical protein
VLTEFCIIVMIAFNSVLRILFYSVVLTECYGDLMILSYYVVIIVFNNVVLL